MRTNEEREQTLNQLLTEMDGFTPDIGVVFIGATNRADLLDPALLRSGRFDRKVRILKPDAQARYDILQVLSPPFLFPSSCTIYPHTCSLSTHLHMRPQDLFGLIKLFG